MARLNDLAAKLELKRGELAHLFQSHKDESGGYKDTLTAAVRDEINTRNNELTVLGKEFDAERGLAEIEAKNTEAAAREGKCVLPNGAKHGAGSPEGSRVDRSAEGKSLGQLFIESKAYLERSTKQESTIEQFGAAEVKTLMTRSAGWAPESLRTGQLVLSAQEMPGVVDVMPMQETSFAAVKYMEETTYTNNAVETAEGSDAGESALALTERSVTVEKIPVWIPVTDEELEDVVGIRDYIDNRLTLMLKQRLDGQLVAGDGSTPNILGILNKSSIGTQAKGTDPTPDAIYKAIVVVRVTGKAIASAILMHPNDWQDVRLLRTADGIYIWGNPADSGPERMWGLPVIQSTNVTQNTGIVGDFRGFAQLRYKRGITIKITDSHASYFIAGKNAIRADFRCCAIWQRASAFCKVTGI